MLLVVIIFGHYNVNVGLLEFFSLPHIHRTIRSASWRPMGITSCFESKKEARPVSIFGNGALFTQSWRRNYFDYCLKIRQRKIFVPFLLEPLVNSIWMGIRKCHVLWFRRILLHGHSQLTHAPLLIIVARRAPFRDICARFLLETHRFMWELHAILSETSRLLTVDSLLCYHALWAAPEIGFVEDPIGRRNVFQFVCGPYFPLSAHLSRVSGPHEVTHEKWSKIVHG